MRSCIPVAFAALLVACGASPSSNDGGVADAGDGGGGIWFTTCGAPVCQSGVDAGIAGLAPCTTEKAGQACSPVGASCDPHLGCNVALQCAASDPKSHGCPISRQRFKEEIRYLGDADLTALERELMRFRIAKYRYKADPAREHLGFIIEDVEPSLAVDSARDQVDLYGYSTMAVAALQSQAREIAALRAEVRALHRQVEERK